VSDQRQPGSDGAPEPGIGRAFPALAWITHPGPVAVRFWKYVVLATLMVLNVVVVFDAYSFYVARRDLDAELRSRKVASIEYLNLAAERQRGLALTTLETRCMERTQLTLFRIFDAEHDQIKKVYNDLMAKKTKLIETIKTLGPGVINVDKANEYIAGAYFTLEKLDDYLKPLTEEAGNSPKYKKLQEEVAKAREAYVAVALSNVSLREELEQVMMRDGKFAPSKYWSMDAIKALEARIGQLQKELESNKNKFGDFEDLIVRYAVWTGSLTGGRTDNPLQDDMAYMIEQAAGASLKDQDCSRFDEYYTAVYRTIRTENPLEGRSWTQLKWFEFPLAVRSGYRQYLLRYFTQPPAAQTMFVTLFLGALGAFTFNMLRMSKVGWWAGHDDPLWGEIIVAPLLGSLAAFGIFLLGSAGLLLTADTNGAQPLSAYFIGLLGFLSGLLYDEAFGRVRRVGMQMFAPKPGQEAANARPEDRSLAEALRTASAGRIASLVLKYGVGTKLGSDREFTLLVPSDEAVGELTLATWNKLNEDAAAFDQWLGRHRAAKRVTRDDVQALPEGKMSMDDGQTRTVVVADGALRVDGIHVAVPDIKWGAGVLHVMQHDLA